MPDRPIGSAPSPIEPNARRLRARGTFELHPWTRNVVIEEPSTENGHTTTYASVPCWHVAWWPSGQGPGRGARSGNPFCQRSYIADTVEEAFQAAVEGTRPRSHDIDEMAAWRARQRSAT